MGPELLDHIEIVVNPILTVIGQTLEHAFIVARVGDVIHL